MLPRRSSTFAATAAHTIVLLASDDHGYGDGDGRQGKQDGSGKLLGSRTGSTVA